MVSQLHAPQTWKPVTALASLTVINTASTHLRNDLARAIKALEQKKQWWGPTQRLFAVVVTPVLPNCVLHCIGMCHEWLHVR